MVKELSPHGSHLTSFEFDGRILPVKYIETTQIEGFPGVWCDVYKIRGDKKRDLGVIYINGGFITPPQEVARVDDKQRTVERYVEGSGRLLVVKPDGTNIIYEIAQDSRVSLSVDMEVGDIMQWRADPGSRLVIYEVCSPPYTDGRFINRPGRFKNK